MGNKFEEEPSHVNRRSFLKLVGAVSIGAIFMPPICRFLQIGVYEAENESGPKIISDYAIQKLTDEEVASLEWQPVTEEELIFEGVEGDYKVKVKVKDIIILTTAKGHDIYISPDNSILEPEVRGFSFDYDPKKLQIPIVVDNYLQAWMDPFSVAPKDKAPGIYLNYDFDNNSWSAAPPPQPSQP